MDENRAEVVAKIREHITFKREADRARRSQERDAADLSEMRLRWGNDLYWTDGKIQAKSCRT